MEHPSVSSSGYFVSVNYLMMWDNELTHRPLSLLNPLLCQGALITIVFGRLIMVINSIILYAHDHMMR